MTVSIAFGLRITRILALGVVGLTGVAGFGPTAGAGDTAQAPGGDLGSIHFPNSGSPEAGRPFIEGVLLLHSFEYKDAREAFQKAQRIDPSFALAYWGEAMTHNHPLWREQDVTAARAALDKLAPTSEGRRLKAPTERERGYLEAVEALYGAGDKPARDLAYAEAMGRLSERFPEDLEARAFHALAILGTAQGIRDFAVYMAAGAIAEEVFASNPMHPGAAHYLIHSYDDPVHAPLGLRAARVYAKIAPAAAHAQHMISHIYVALGRWAESVDANIKSFDVSVARRDRKNLEVDALNFHALHWLEYSYLQLGRFQDARARLEAMAGWAKQSDSPRVRWHLAAMRAAWIVETGGRPAPVGLNSEEVSMTGAAADHFATGYAAILEGRRDAAEESARRIAARHDAAAAGHLCAQTGTYTDTSKTDLIVAEVLRKSLLALVAWDRGDTVRAIALLEEATAAEEAMPLDFGPPVIVKPSHELLGELLLRLQRPKEAGRMFEKALERAPRRSLSLSGLARAAAATSATERLARACSELADIYAGADASVRPPEPCASRTAAGGGAAEPARSTAP